MTLRQTTTFTNSKFVPVLLALACACTLLNFFLSPGRVEPWSTLRLLSCKVTRWRFCCETTYRKNLNSFFCSLFLFFSWLVVLVCLRFSPLCMSRTDFLLFFSGAVAYTGRRAGAGTYGPFTRTTTVLCRFSACTASTPSQSTRGESSSPWGACCRFPSPRAAERWERSCFAKTDTHWKWNGICFPRLTSGLVDLWSLERMRSTIVGGEDVQQDFYDLTWAEQVQEINNFSFWYLQREIHFLTCRYFCRLSSATPVADFRIWSSWSCTLA